MTMEPAGDTIRGDKRVISQILGTLKSLGYTGWNDWRTRVNFETLTEPVAKELAAFLAFTKIFLWRGR